MRFTISGFHGCALVIGALAAANLVAYVSADCSNVEWGVDYEGGWNLNEGKQTYTDSDWACCNKCQQDHRCVSWSRVQWATGNLRKGDCWLHGGGQYKKYKNYINSGKKGGGSSGDSCDIKKNLDIGGGEVLNNGRYEKTGSDWDCCQKCNNNQQCKYWTRVQDDYHGSTKGECWLRKSYVWRDWYSPGFNSGEKKWSRGNSLKK